MNDFDETLPGPWEWDVKRLAASMAIAGRERGFSNKERAGIVVDTACAYRTEMARLATCATSTEFCPDRRRHGHEGDRPCARAWGRQAKQEDLVHGEGTRRQATGQGRTRDSLQALGKLTEVVNGETRFVSNPPLLVPIAELVPEAEAANLTEGFHDLLLSYGNSLQSDRRHLLKQFRFAGIAAKVVGVGSVGTRAWAVLMLGSNGVDPLLLQAKEAQESVLAPFVGKSHYASEGERVVAGQHLMQASSDIFLGWDTVDGLDGVRRDFSDVGRPRHPAHRVSSTKSAESASAESPSRRLGCGMGR